MAFPDNRYPFQALVQLHISGGQYSRAAGWASKNNRLQKGVMICPPSNQRGSRQSDRQRFGSGKAASSFPRVEGRYRIGIRVFVQDTSFSTSCHVIVAEILDRVVVVECQLEFAVYLHKDVAPIREQRL